MNKEKEIKYLKDKAIVNQNMLVDISNIIEIQKNSEKKNKKIKQVFKNNKWKI